MTEILWKTNAPHLPVQNHELVELRIVDLGSKIGPRYLLREIRATWSATAQQFEWKGFEDKTYTNERDARESFASRRDSIVRAGYPFRTTLN